MSDLGQPHLAVHLGVFAAGDVVVDLVRRLLEHLHFQGAVGLPLRQQGMEALQRWLVVMRLRIGRALGNGVLYDGRAQDLGRLPFAQPRDHLLEDRLDDIRLDAALFQNRQIGLGHWLLRRFRGQLVQSHARRQAQTLDLPVAGIII